MTYAAFEGSIESGRPVEVYEFTIGASSLYLTSAEDAVTLSAQTYTPEQGLSRNQNIDGPEKRDYDFQITVPTVSSIAKIFRGKIPGFRIRVQVSRFHRDDLPTPEVTKIFDGYVQSASFKKGGKETILTCRTALSSAGRAIPRRTFQSACNHVLYHPTTCKVDDTDAAFRASALAVSSIAGHDLTVSSGIAGTYADGWMNGGYVEVIGKSEYRMVTKQVGNVLTLHLPFSETPSSINVFAGCGHTISVCDSKFKNVVEYGGFNWVPTSNPFEIGFQ